AEDGIRDRNVTGVQTCALPIYTAKTIEGLPRHVGTHAAGVVISDRSLENIVPLQSGNGVLHLTQYTMGAVEEIGLLKMDFLGLKIGRASCREGKWYEVA